MSGGKTRGGYNRGLGDVFGFQIVHDPASADTFYRTNLPRWGLTSVAIAATAIMTNARVHLRAGDVITNIGFTTGGTAAGTPTAWWVALYSDASTPALMAQSADQTTTAMAANTNFTVALATAQTIPRTGIYRAAIMVAATTVPTLLGVTAAKAGLVTGESAVSQSSGSALAATAPSTIATPTELVTVPRFVLT